jgi:hypothetical protein
MQTQSTSTLHLCSDEDPHSPQPYNGQHKKALRADMKHKLSLAAENKRSLLAYIEQTKHLTRLHTIAQIISSTTN